MPSHVLRRSFDSTKMEIEKMDQKPPRTMKLNKLPELDVEFTMKKNSHMLVSPLTSPSNALLSPTSQPMSRKSSSGRLNCLCSPTTHVGSFRCRHHRSSSGISRGKSIGTNLAELGSKADSFSDSLNAQ